MEPTAAPPASPRQLLAVNAIILLAVASFLAQPYFPTWLQPTTYGLAPRSASANRLMLAQLSAAESISHVTGDSHVLIVGDSVVSSCPWPIDKLSRPGMSTQGLRAQLTPVIENQSYDHIIVWAGTWDMMQGKSVERYVEDAAQLVADAREHGAEVILIGPMPSSTVGQMTPENRMNVVAVASAVRQLRARLPETQVVDMGAFRELASTQPRTDTLFLDNMHISRDGFALLNAEFLHLRFAAVAT